MPPKLAAAVGNAPGTAVAQRVTPPFFPDEGDAAAHARDLRSLHMRLNLAVAEVQTQRLLVLWRDVLVPQEDDLALGYEERKLVPLLVRKVLELQSDDLSLDKSAQSGVLSWLKTHTNMRRKVAHLLSSPKQRLLLLIGARGWVNIWLAIARILAHGLDIAHKLGLGREVRVPAAKVNAGLGVPPQRVVRRQMKRLAVQLECLEARFECRDVLA
jgi:hypothetical protein